MPVSQLLLQLLDLDLELIDLGYRRIYLALVGVVLVSAFLLDGVH